jgi:carboxylesterase type B
VEPHLGEDELKTRVAEVAGGDTDAVLALYRRMHPGMNPAELLIEITTDARFWVRSVLLAERKAAKGKAPVYMYSFNWQTPVFDGKLMAQHALDVPFVFDTLDRTGITGHSPAAPAIAAVESATWAAFARTGTPDNKAIPHWPRLYRGRSGDNDDRHRVARAERSAARGAAVVDQDRAGMSACGRNCWLAILSSARSCKSCAPIRKRGSSRTRCGNLKSCL